MNRFLIRSIVIAFFAVSSMVSPSLIFFNSSIIDKKVSNTFKPFLKMKKEFTNHKRELFEELYKHLESLDMNWYGPGREKDRDHYLGLYARTVFLCLAFFEVSERKTIFNEYKDYMGSFLEKTYAGESDNIHDARQFFSGVSDKIERLMEAEIAYEENELRKLKSLENPKEEEKEVPLSTSK